MSITFDDLRYVADEYVLPFGLRLLIALVVFYLGRTIARALMRALDRVMDRSKLDVSLRKFLHDVAYAVTMVAVVIAALDSLGVKTTAVVAVLGAAGLAIGLALQGSLSNFAAGVMLIVLRPYKVGDVVVIAKYAGRVDAIKVFNTILVTDDHREITIPNGQIIGAPIENLTVLGRRRVDLVVIISDDGPKDLERVRGVVRDAMTGDARIHATPGIAVEIAAVSDANVKLTVRPWTTVADYDAVACDAMRRLANALGAAGLRFAITLGAAPAAVAA
jgi:small conductance mechanosensitive channel